MSPTYKRWIFHGDTVDLSPFLRSNSRFLGATFSNVSECRKENVNLRENIGVRDTMDDEMVEMIHDLHGPMFEECRRESNEQDESDKISGMFPEIEEELYPGCLKFTSFNFLVKLMHINVLNHWSDKSFDMLLELLNEAFPNGVKLPVSYYEAKKRLRDLGMGYEAIHGWKHFDEQYPCFASDARNVRLALSLDGFNPFGNMNTSYSMWPVILIPYNLPPWKCMKAPFTFLSLLIPGPRSPGKEIDIYLQPLIDELNELWVDGTILNIDGKTKDTIKAREDLVNLKIRKELHIQEIGNKRVKPHASYTLSAAEKVDFCTFLKSVKFPDGFASNISRCVNLKEGKIYGLKSHDCHVLLQRLLSISIRPYLRKDISTTISELSNFFHALCKKTLSISKLDKMQDDIILNLCKLEKIFPPAFFDVMVHLAVHLPWEARIVGPVGYSWMYPIERSLRYLKQYVRNKARPESSIAEAYVINESLNFCSMYLRGIETRFNRGDQNNDDINDEEINNRGLSIFSQHIRWLGDAVFRQLTLDELEKSHWLHELAKHREHMRILESSNGNGDLYKRKQLEFPTWFKAKAQRLHCDKFISDDLYALACGPNDCARSYSGCIANGVRFHTKDHDSRRTTQNSGVIVPGGDETGQIFFYGELHEIIRLQYICMKAVVLFKCEWMSSRNFGPGNRSRSSSNMNEANNSNQNSIGEQEVMSIDSDIQKTFVVHYTKATKSMTLQLKHENTVTNEWHEIRIGLVYVIDGNEKILRVDLKQILRHALNFHSPIEKEEGKEVSEIELFQLTHSNEKNGWVNEAKEKYDEMVELKTTSSQEGSEPLLEREICDRVLGKRSGHVKRQGWETKTQEC
ncbi:uncharacterized protein E6C27_scaffold69G00560 [Cucumis melo var. makuwa]|uniref:DUF4218 domain-containing protein n=1 Tax=Cucumis melo var. makuwa TaxID=1194695 RepID=A0A5A7T3L6_CUCMM|nr:uncharacterized protein E6C27_scaffold69G00560 [Cucumis melo var. makuwa]